MNINGNKIKSEFVHFRVPDILMQSGRKRKGNPKDIAPYHRKYSCWRPHTHGGATMCRLYYFNNSGRKVTVGMGRATCLMSDNFCYRTGRYYAVRHAIEDFRNRDISIVQ